MFGENFHINEYNFNKLEVGMEFVGYNSLFVFLETKFDYKIEQRIRRFCKIEYNKTIREYEITIMAIPPNCELKDSMFYRKWKRMRVRHKKFEGTKWEDFENFYNDTFKEYKQLLKDYTEYDISFFEDHWWQNSKIVQIKNKRKKIGKPPIKSPYIKYTKSTMVTIKREEKEEDLLDFTSEAYTPIAFESELPIAKVYQEDERIPYYQFKEKYYTYLLSKEWKLIRKKILSRDGNRCQWCGDYHSLHIHHLTYDRVYHEDLDDLITLCSQCHENYHKRKKYAESQGKPFN